MNPSMLSAFCTYVLTHSFAHARRTETSVRIDMRTIGMKFFIFLYVCMMDRIGDRTDIAHSHQSGRAHIQHRTRVFRTFCNKGRTSITTIACDNDADDYNEIVETIVPRISVPIGIVIGCRRIKRQTTTSIFTMILLNRPWC